MGELGGVGTGFSGIFCFLFHSSVRNAFESFVFVFVGGGGILRDGSILISTLKEGAMHWFRPRAPDNSSSSSSSKHLLIFFFFFFTCLCGCKDLCLIVSVEI